MHICFISIKWHVSPHSVSRECMIPISIWINHHNAGSLPGVKVCDLYDKQKPWPFILWRKNRYQHVLGNTLFWIINLWMLWQRGSIAFFCSNEEHFVQIDLKQIDHYMYIHFKFISKLKLEWIAKVHEHELLCTKY